MSVIQTITVTPTESYNETTALYYVGTLLPDNVIEFLNIKTLSGERSAANISVDGGTYTYAITYTDDCAQQYKELMAGVSAGIKTQLVNEGWEISFDPETADL